MSKDKEKDTLELNMIKTNLWEIRQQKKMTVKEVARKSRLSQSTITDIENEKISPRLNTLEKIAAGLNCKITDLFESEYK